VAPSQVGADSLHPVGLPAVVPVRDVAIAAAEHTGGVDRAANRLPRAVDAAGVRDRDNRPQQRLARNAGPIRTFTTDQLLLHHRDPESGGTGPFGDALADRSGANDDDVVAVFALFLLRHSHDWLPFGCAGSDCVAEFGRNWGLEH
jgi:hypothetical protein